MHVSFSLPDLLRLFKHLRGNRVQGIASHPLLRVTAVDGQLCLENPSLAVGIEALVVEPGSFVVERTHFARLLRSFASRDTLTIQAGPSHLSLGTFRINGPLEGYDPQPRLPELFERPRYGRQKVPSTVFASGAYSVAFGVLPR